ncbi:MAG: hypothetical protein IJO93_07330 [Clostridia bacterium]|nr:hypothetical protein [Clostridia bacterium]
MLLFTFPEHSGIKKDWSFHMRLWGRLYTDGEKQREGLITVNIRKKEELTMHEAELTNALAQLAYDMDLERPVMVKKHWRDLYEFSRVVFLPQDFMDSVDFDRLVVEVISD